MATRQVDVDSLVQVVNLLGTYIKAVNLDIQKMKHAAIDCSDNMGNDELSRQAISDLEDCAKELSKTTVEAEELKKKIQEQIKRIEEMRRRN